MVIKIITMADRRRPGTPETIEDASAVLIQLDHRETIEITAVVRTTMTRMRNHGITSLDAETIGEEDHEMLSVEILSMTKRSMAEEGTGEIAPITLVLTGEELTETLMIIGLE